MHNFTANSFYEQTCEYACSIARISYHMNCLNSNIAIEYALHSSMEQEGQQWSYPSSQGESSQILVVCKEHPSLGSVELSNAPQAIIQPHHCCTSTICRTHLRLNACLDRTTQTRIEVKLLLKQGDSANAVPHYQKLRTRVTHIWGNRKGQPNRSAMERPRPGRTAVWITVSPVPGKYAVLRVAFTSHTDMKW